MAKPSDYELKLLRSLWRHDRLSAREIHEATRTETGWSLSATRKTLDRMVEKGLVRCQPVHGVNTFAAAQGKLETLAGLMTAFARDVLDLDAPLPAAAFTGSRLVEPDEVAALEALLARMAAEEEGGEA